MLNFYMNLILDFLFSVISIRMTIKGRPLHLMMNSTFNFSELIL